MSDEMGLEELSQRTGEPTARLRRWRSLGLIGDEDGERFGPEDVERARLIQLCLRRGIGIEVIAAAEKQQRFLRHWVELMFPSGVSRTYSLAEAAEILGLELEPFRRFWDAAGLSDQGETFSEEDLEVMKTFKVAVEAGFPEEAMLQMVRVYADALGRVAEAEARLFHFYVHERMKAAGVTGPELAERTESAQGRLMPLVEPAILYFHRKGMARAAREDMVMHMAEEAGLLERAEVPAQMRMAIVFVDLASFTPLAEAMGDLEAARVLERFSEVVREAVNRWEGRVVKQIGDAFMLVFTEPRSAVACALEIEAQTAGEPQFPAVRSGVHWGVVLYREGDYLGSNVNIASRLATEAQRHQVLVTAAVRKEATGLAEVEFVPLGKRRLKGLTEELEVFEARPKAGEERERLVDPVCGMELGPAEAAAKLSLEGQDRAFCSEACLRRFVAAPERYTR